MRVGCQLALARDRSPVAASDKCSFLVPWEPLCVYKVKG